MFAQQLCIARVSYLYHAVRKFPIEGDYVIFYSFTLLLASKVTTSVHPLFKSFISRYYLSHSCVSQQWII